MASGLWLSGCRLTTLALTPTDIYHRHYGGMSKILPLTDLQIPATVATAEFIVF